jgi:hypothetical protein
MRGGRDRAVSGPQMPANAHRCARPPRPVMFPVDRRQRIGARVVSPAVLCCRMV